MYLSNHVRSVCERFGISLQPARPYTPTDKPVDDGRGPVTWRLPWSFACPLHRVLLLDFCPACHRPPRPWNARRLGPRAGGACTRDNPVTSARRGGCGTDLTSAEAVPLPAGGLVLAAHQRLAALMTSPPGTRPAAVTELREVYATACRALRGLHAIPGYDSIAAAARALYGGRDGALQQMIRKTETAVGFPIIDRSSTPLTPDRRRPRAHPRSTPDPPGRPAAGDRAPSPGKGTRGGRGLARSC